MIFGYYCTVVSMQHMRIEILERQSGLGRINYDQGRYLVSVCGVSKDTGSCIVRIARVFVDRLKRI